MATGTDAPGEPATTVTFAKVMLQACAAGMADAATAAALGVAADRWLAEALLPAG